jgi:molybdopterin synthase catalytic subunit
MFKIVDERINIQELINAVLSPECGAISIFIGTVRNNTQGKEVIALEYEAYEEMAEKIMNQIIDEIMSKWKIKKVAVQHRKGKLEVGEISIAIAVSAPHREDAIHACKYAIDRLKQIVPIWKKEIFHDGEVWIQPHS